MPYYVHAKDTDPDTRQFGIATRAEAFEYLKTHYSVETHTITFQASEDEMDEWRRRERYRYIDGPYIPVPWNDRQRADLKTLHYAHLSVDKPGMVAYTADVEAGVNDKQTRITPGRYLERFYADVFSRDEIAKYVAEVTGCFSEFKLARTAEDIRTVYRNGPSSCMGGGPLHTDQYWRSANLDGHDPTDVYAEPSDLAVAYFGPIDHCSQRSVVWPENKTYQRVYGSGPLEKLLQDAGYTEGSPDGARILNIPMRGGHLMPYIDHDCPHNTCHCVTKISSEFLQIGEDGNICGHTTAGYSFVDNRRSDDDEDDEDDNDYIRCERCGSRTYVDDAVGDLCQSCDDERWTCDGCESTFYADERATGIDDNRYCESCTRERTSECADQNCSHTWIEQNEFTSSEREERTRHDLADLCRSCAARYVWCEHCEHAHDDDTCPDCGRSPRCEHTGDLLSVGELHTVDDDRALWKLLIYQNGAWTPCYWLRDHPSDYAIGDYGRVSDFRDRLQSLYPDVRYQVVYVGEGSLNATV